MDDYKLNKRKIQKLRHGSDLNHNLENLNLSGFLKDSAVGYVTLVSLLTSMLFMGVCRTYQGDRQVQIRLNEEDIEKLEIKSEKRHEFEEKFGIDLDGKRKYFEKKPSNFSRLAGIIHKERLEREFEINEIEIKGEVEDTDDEGETLGRYHPDNQSIVIQAPLKENISVVHHEIKHDKYNEVAESRDSFKTDWKKEISSQGDLTYNDDLDVLFSRDISKSRKSGFITDYAGKNAKEAFAELGEMAESKPEILYEISKKYKAIKELADFHERIDTISEHAIDYGRLKDLHHQRFKKDDFLSKSKNFLNNNPDCIYECQLRKMRVETLSSLSQREEAKEIEIKKLKEGLKARYKHPEVYPEILQNIRDFYGDLGKDEKAKIYEKAAEEYEDRFDSGDLDLTYRGVNDFLRKKGELKGQ